MCLYKSSSRYLIMVILQRKIHSVIVLYKLTKENGILCDYRPYFLISIFLYIFDVSLYILNDKSS